MTMRGLTRLLNSAEEVSKGSQPLLLSLRWANRVLVLKYSLFRFCCLPRGIERRSLVAQRLMPFFVEIGVKLRQADFISKSASLGPCGSAAQSTRTSS